MAENEKARTNREDAPQIGASNAAGVKPAGPSGEKPAGPSGVKPAGPSGVKPAGPSGVKQAGPSGVKPAGPAGVKPAGPSGVKPAGPAGAKPTGPSAPGSNAPTGANAAGPSGVKPAGPPGARPALTAGAPSSAPTGGRRAAPLGADQASRAGTKQSTPAGAIPAGPAGNGATRPSAGGARPAAPLAARPARPTLPPGAASEGDGGPATPTRKDFASDQDVRWCPGCGDYAILATVQRLMPQLGIPRENVVFISGIGCSSRFPYYMNTYGMHSIHGRAPTVATGLKASRPELDVWIVTGDGDALSIGGNHLIHLMRRNVDLQLLLFNNQIYGLTKGQYSPTSERGKVTKSTPFGSIDHPFNPAALALGADATFVARTMDRDPKHMQQVFKKAHEHAGSSFVEIYQNCNIFNDGAFFSYTEKDTKPLNALFLEHGKPMVFDGGRRGLRLDGLKPRMIDLTNGQYGVDDCLLHDETSIELANIVARLFWQPEMPRPFGIFYRDARPTYEAMLHEQVARITEKKGIGDLQALLESGDTWTI